MHKLASEAVVKRFISALPEQQRVRFVDPDRGLSVADLANQAEAVDLFMGAMRDKGKDVNFFIGNTPEILEKTGGTAREGVAGFYDPDSNTVFVNTDAETPSFTLFHELFHPTERWSAMSKKLDADTGETVKSDPLQDIQTDLAQTIFGTYGPDGDVIQPGLYSKEDMLSFADQYNSRLYPDLSTEIKEVKAAIEAEKKKTLPEIDGIEPPETPEMRLLNRELEKLQTRQESNQKELAAFDALPDATKRDYMARELMSDYFAMFGESARHGIIRKARNITLKKDYFKDKFLGMNIDRLRMATLGNLRKLLERSGVEFDLAGNPRGEMTATSALFKDPETGRELVMSPQIEHLLAQYITEKDKLVNRVSETDDVGGSEITLNAKDVLKKNPDGTPKIPEAEIKRWASSGWLKTDKEGNVLNSTGGRWQPGQRPAFTTARERTRMDKNRVAALVTALTPVTQKIDADAPFEPTVKSKQTADGGTNFRGSYFDEQQMDAIMATPDDVIHPDLKSVIKTMNDAIKEGKGAPFLADYWKAITGRGYDSKARMKVQLFTPIGMQISSAGNFNATVFNIGYFENKINRWLGQAGKKKFWSDWADADGRVDVDGFRTDMMELLKTHYENDPSKIFPPGMKKEKLYSFLGVKPEDLSRKDWNRAAKDFKLFISLRFDRMKDVTRGMGDNFPVNYYKAKQRFMPGEEGGFNEAKNTFGTTQDLLEAGYILPDGELLDFSGRHEGADERDVAGQRYSDHREISQAGTDMQAFIDSGAVRIDARNGLIETGQEPTGSQYNQIRKIIEDKDSEVYIDLKDPDRNDAAEMFTVIQPEPGTDPKRVIGLIRRFYRGDDISGAVRFMPATPEPRPAQDKLGFFSRVEQVASGNKIPNRGTGEQMLATIAKQPGVKQEEIAWLGLEDFLRGKKQVTKDELVEFIRENDVQLEETMLGADGTGDRGGYYSDSEAWGDEPVSFSSYDEAERFAVDLFDLSFQEAFDFVRDEQTQRPSTESPTQYGEYQLPGAEPGSYRELLLRLPKDQNKIKSLQQKLDKLNDRFKNDATLDTEGLAKLSREAATIRKKIEQLGGPAYSYDQSKMFMSSHFSEPNILSHVRFNDRTGPDGEKILFLEELQSDWHQEGRKRGYRGDIPDAPFKSSWHELTLKRMLRYAAENGYDKLAFIDGKETADRYDLSNKVGQIQVARDEETGRMSLLADNDIIDADFDSSKLESYVGKEVANRVNDMLEKEAPGMGGSREVSLTGDDLRVGGQWAFNLYDRMIPQFLKKYGKKFGAKVEDVGISTTDAEYRDQFANLKNFKAIDITPQMRGEEGVLGGQVRFMPAERNDRKNRVSTRLPTAVAATEDPLASTLLIDSAAVFNLPPEKQKVMAGIITKYPHIKTNKRDLPVVGDELMNMSVSNLLWLYDKVPEDVRKRSKLWYDGARKITNDWVKKYGTSNAESAGVIAVLSPQKDWFMNVSLAERVIDAYKNKQDVAVNQDMIAKASEITQFSKDELIMKVIRSMKNKKYADLDPLEKAYFMRLYDQTYRPQSFPVISPEGKMLDVKMNDNGTVGKVIHASSPAYMKAISILENPTKENISTQLGGQHKVRNFNNNILLPKLATEDVTIDTHAVAAALLKPLTAKSIEVGHNFGSGVPNSSITGGKGTYGIYADAYRKAAEQRGVMPREMQSITWEAVRGLFPQRMKNKKNNKIVDDIWGEYNRGKISLDEARDKISDAFGGIRNPSWYGRDK